MFPFCEATEISAIYHLLFRRWLIIKYALRTHFAERKRAQLREEGSLLHFTCIHQHVSDTRPRMSFLSNLLSYHVLLKTWSRWHSDPRVSWNILGHKQSSSCSSQLLSELETGRHPLLSPNPHSCLFPLGGPLGWQKCRVAAESSQIKCQMDLFF